MATRVNYTTQHKGTLFPSILNIPMTNGSGGAVYADQINWGDDSQFDGIPFTTTSFLLSTIDNRIKDAKANGGLKQNEVEAIVSAYYGKVSIIIILKGSNSTRLKMKLVAINLRFHLKSG